MKKIILTTLLTLFFAHTAMAEYRVYQYVVKNKINIKDAPNSHVIISTLNPRSYISYNGGSNLINVDLLRTWMCPGFTGLRKKTCDSPYGRLPAEIIK
jgi:hypothetical protein